MPGLRAPSDYSEEPPRHSDLLVNSKEPYNAEPHRSALTASYVTPVEFFYKRNHGPIPIVDDMDNSIFHPCFPLFWVTNNRIYCVIHVLMIVDVWLCRYSVTIAGLIDNPTEMYMKDIMKLPKYVVTATLQCAGNRRTAMNKNRKLLADVLELIGISKLSHISQLGGKHVEFVSIDKCKEENGCPYKASIPLSQATNSEADVLLAYEMNGETLNRDHGYPLRVIVPGVIGARSVKWLDSINIIPRVLYAKGLQNVSAFSQLG